MDMDRKVVPNKWTRTAELLFLLVVFLAALSIRYPICIDLDLSFTLDETFDVSVAHRIYKNFPHIPYAGGRPPAYHLLLALVFKVFGYSIWNARLVTALLGSLTVLYIYFLGKILQDWKVGGLASILLTLLPHHVFYSRVVTLYVPMLFFATAGFYHAVLGVRHQSRTNTVLGSLLFALSILVLDLALVIVVIIPIWLIFELRRSTVLPKGIHILAGYLRKHPELALLIVFPGFTWISWQFWAMPRGYASHWGPEYTWQYYISAQGGRALSMIYLRSLTERFLGIYLSTLLAMLLIAEFFKKRTGLFGSKLLEKKVETKWVTNSAIAYYALLLIFFCFQLIGVIKHHSYLLTPQFWIGSSIIFALIMRLILSDREAELPSIWMLVSLGLYSFLSDKLIRYIFIICSPLMLVCASSVVSSMEDESRIKRAILICLLLVVLVLYIRFDLSGGWVKDRYKLWDLSLL